MPAYFDTGFSVREPMWHGQGLVLDDYPVDWADARVKSGLEWEPALLPAYTLPKVPCVFCSRELGTAHQASCKFHEVIDGQGSIVTAQQVDPTDLIVGIKMVENHRLVTRDDTDAVLGMVSDQFALISHAKMGGILEAVLGITNVKFETAGACKMGAQVWALAYLDEPFTVAGDDSQTYPFLVLLNNHDGSGACKLIATSIRVVCWNTYRAAEMQGERSGRQFIFRHVGDVEDRVDEAMKAIAGVRDEAKEWDALATELFGMKVDDPMVEEFLAAFLPEPVGEVASKRVHGNVDRARKAFRTLYFDSPTNAAHIGTGLGLIDASVEYLDHVRGYRSSDTLMGRTLLRPEPLKARAVSIVRELVNA